MQNVIVIMMAMSRAVRPSSSMAVRTVRHTSSIHLMGISLPVIDLEEDEVGPTIGGGSRGHNRARNAHQRDV